MTIRLKSILSIWFLALGTQGMHTTGRPSTTVPYSKLERAAAEGDLVKVQTLIEKDPKLLNKKGVLNWMTPLHFAAERDQLPVVKFLVEKGAKVNVTDDQDRTPLHKAARQGYLPVVTYLVNNRAKINMRDNMGFTPLHFAVKALSLRMVKFLVANGADPNIRDKRELPDLKSGLPRVKKALLGERPIDYLPKLGGNATEKSIRAYLKPITGKTKKKQRALAAKRK